MKTLVDTNVLIRYMDETSPDNSMCVRALETLTAQGSDLSVCAQVLIEYWAVATRPLSANGLGFSVEKVDRQITEVCSAFTHLPEPGDIASEWRKLASLHAVIGKQAHDARIVALMLSHSIARILTFNASDFFALLRDHCRNTGGYPAFHFSIGGFACPKSQ